MEAELSQAPQIITERPTTPTTPTPIASSSAKVVIPTTTATSLSTSTKVLKRCLSVPLIPNLPTAKTGGTAHGYTTCPMTTRAAAAAQKSKLAAATAAADQQINTYKNYSANENSKATIVNNNNGGMNTQVVHSNPSSREVSPAPVFNIFSPRARRYSASYSPHASASGTNVVGGLVATSSAPLRLTPRVSQLRQEECIDINSREVNHEREIHSALQISQSWEDLTLVAENWSFKSDELSNPLQLALPAGAANCSSPSPTSNRAGLRLPYGLSPSPTRRTFATRRSMSPIAMRPSQLGPVKRKFELDDTNCSNWNIYSPPPLKKFSTESRGSSPVCQSPSSICPSPDSGTYDGRITPKLFISKLCTTNTNSNNSACCSPMSAQPMGLTSSGLATGDSAGGSSTSGMVLSPSTSLSLSICSGSEPMSINTAIDEGISVSDVDEKSQRMNEIITMKRMSTDMQDDATLMDDNKSETSSIGGCSSLSTESSSFYENANKTMATSVTPSCFLNKLVSDDGVSTAISSPNKSFIINKQGFSGPKKFIVNHDNLPNSASKSTSICRSFSRNSSIENMDCINNLGDISSGGIGAKIKKSTGDMSVCEESKTSN